MSTGARLAGDFLKTEEGEAVAKKLYRCCELHRRFYAEDVSKLRNHLIKANIGNPDEAVKIDIDVRHMFDDHERGAHKHSGMGRKCVEINATHPR